MKITFKICGLTRAEDVAAATLVGASYLGFIMVPGTPRCITVESARRLFAVSSLPKKVLVVGDLSIAEVQRLIDDLRPDYIQLHRNEPPEFAQALRGARIWRAFTLKTLADVEAAAIYPADAIVADTGMGGSGQVGDWELARRLAMRKPVILAGGITAENVCAGFEASGAFAVDCSSGVEAAPGVKDTEKLTDFANVCNGL
ncbi:MAG: phosphoribosylanthranilate isomerase [Victivallales bacterium]|nr:phosphoribosylanthranilate isomerase [Victivallales bacterium]